MTALRNKILEILENDARIPPSEIAVMLDEDESTVSQEIDRMEKEGVILGYKVIVNPERVTEDKVSCLIEVSVQPERGYGFDKIAERIYRFPEVRSVLLVSGRYDLLLLLEGRTMREIADFVIEKLSVLPNVHATASHFLLKKYKEQGITLVAPEKRDRLPVSP
ncbi:MAG: Lrp/AsnC family transcriptional regulator [Candidatus Omnitrophica bacterium]|nr:Lrp/AsnC family transcriptional regulator [Candidatus Omnitrophota bacterium]